MKKVFFIVSKYIMILILFISFILFITTDDDLQKSRLLFNCIQAIMFLVITNIPKVFNKKLNIPDYLIILFEIFCLCHFALGEIGRFYINVSWWDSMLHTLSGFTLGILGFSFVSLANQSKDLDIKLVLIFSISFGTTIGVLWEILEFLIDIFLKTNMQRFVDDKNLTPYVGQVALYDTMKDLILDFLGASMAALLGGFSIKKNVSVLNKIYFK